MEATVANIRDTFGKLIGVLSEFSPQQIDAAPFEGSWTAGQVGEHLVKGLSGLPRLVAGKTQQTERPYDEKVKAIRAVFLDFNTKMDSPDFIMPTQQAHSKAALIAELSQIENDLVEIAKSQDLTITCLDYEIPGFGPMTAYEWIAFFTAHAQRHTRQLENIFAKLN